MTVTPLHLLLGTCLLLGSCARDELHPVPPPGGTQPVLRLSELGIFAGDPAEQVPAPGFVPYEVNVPLYADGAGKGRFVFVPADQRIHVTARHWELPIGAYLVKTFSVRRDARDPASPERFIETRVLVQTDDGLHGATYVWDEQQTDAFSSPGGVDAPVSWIDERGVAQRQVFHVPSAAECTGCHADRAIGWRVEQLDRPGSYADGTRDQIAHLFARGVIDAVPHARPPLVDPFGTAPLELRARSYLDANCGHCHASGGSADYTGVRWDYASTGAASLPLCRSTESIDGADHVIVPGHPEASEFLARMRSSSASVRMPRGGRRADEAGIALLAAWVAAMPSRTCR